LVAPVFFKVTPRHGPCRNIFFQQYIYCCASIRCCGNVLAKPLPRNGPGVSAHLAIVA
jgi:hypothetical protein